MQPAIVSRLVEINREFYQQFAVSFDETRRRIQPGVAGLLDELTACRRILDLGCGNGELFETLHQRGFTGEYTGLDFSPELVNLANGRIPAGASARFQVADLSTPDWVERLVGTFNCVLAFAVFHHLPEPLPERIFSEMRGRLSPGGRFFHSNWQFLNSPRWRDRVQPWEKAAVDPASVGPHDYLLDWRRGGTGLRYVHYFSEEELNSLAEKTGFNVVRSFHSDGKEGDLALYQVWE